MFYKKTYNALFTFFVILSIQHLNASEGTGLRYTLTQSRKGVFKFTARENGSKIVSKKVAIQPSGNKYIIINMLNLDEHENISANTYEMVKKKYECTMNAVIPSYSKSCAIEESFARSVQSSINCDRLYRRSTQSPSPKLPILVATQEASDDYYHNMVLRSIVRQIVGQ